MDRLAASAPDEAFTKGCDLDVCLGIGLLVLVTEETEFLRCESTRLQKPPLKVAVERIQIRWGNCMNARGIYTNL